MQKVYSNESGDVLRDGAAVTIEYVPEPGVSTPYAVLTGGDAQRADGEILVEFDQLVRASSKPGSYRKLMLVASPERPNLRALALRALEEKADV